MSNSEIAQALSDIHQFAHTAPDIVAVQEFCVSRWPSGYLITT
jgi:hypothetical protein